MNRTNFEVFVNVVKHGFFVFDVFCPSIDTKNKEEKKKNSFLLKAGFH